MNRIRSAAKASLLTRTVLCLLLPCSSAFSTVVPYVSAGYQLSFNFHNGTSSGAKATIGVYDDKHRQCLNTTVGILYGRRKDIYVQFQHMPILPDNFDHDLRLTAGYGFGFSRISYDEKDLIRPMLTVIAGTNFSILGLFINESVVLAADRDINMNQFSVIPQIALPVDF